MRYNCFSCSCVLSLCYSLSLLISAFNLLLLSFRLSLSFSVYLTCSLVFEKYSAWCLRFNSSSWVICNWADSSCCLESTDSLVNLSFSFENSMRSMSAVVSCHLRSSIYYSNSNESCTPLSSIWLLIFWAYSSSKAYCCIFTICNSQSVLKSCLFKVLCYS